MADRTYRMNVTLTDQTVINAGEILVPETGEAGIGITSIEVQYAPGEDHTTIPTSWTDSIPSVEQGKYLWTRVEFTLTDGNGTTAYMVSYYGIDGKDGEDGEDGIGVTNVQLTEV